MPCKIHPSSKTKCLSNGNGLKQSITPTTPHDPTSSRRLVERCTSSSSANETKPTLKSNIYRNTSLQSHPRWIIQYLWSLKHPRNKYKRKLLLISTTETYLRLCINQHFFYRSEQMKQTIKIRRGHRDSWTTSEMTQPQTLHTVTVSNSNEFLELIILYIKFQHLLIVTIYRPCPRYNLRRIPQCRIL